MTGTRETMCTYCNHRNICKNVDTYRKVVEAIHSVSIQNADKQSFISITNIDWLTDIYPKCKYYQLESNSFR